MLIVFYSSISKSSLDILFKYSKYILALCYRKCRYCLFSPERIIRYVPTFSNGNTSRKSISCWGISQNFMFNKSQRKRLAMILLLPAHYSIHLKKVQQKLPKNLLQFRLLKSMDVFRLHLANIILTHCPIGLSYNHCYSSDANILNRGFTINQFLRKCYWQELY